MEKVGRARNEGILKGRVRIANLIGLRTQLEGGSADVSVGSALVSNGRNWKGCVR